MQVVYERCCGVDVHKKGIVACLRDGRRQELREYKTTTQSLREMAAWLQANECEMVAMESTGSYWKSLYNVLEALGLPVMVVNASHMKAVPGRKTDANDAQWIADLLQHGLLKASFIPDREQRELREVSRYRKSLVEERTREINRLQKELEGANIKLSSVMSNINGKTSRKVLEGVIAGKTDEESIREMVDHRVLHKVPEIMEAIDGVVSAVQKKLLRAIISHIDDMTQRIKEMDDIIDGEMHRYDRPSKSWRRFRELQNKAPERSWQRSAWTCHDSQLQRTWLRGQGYVLGTTKARGNGKVVELTRATKH